MEYIIVISDRFELTKERDIRLEDKSEKSVGFFDCNYNFQVSILNVA